jgi:hypothetical protein
MLLLVIGSGAGTTRSESNANIQIDLWNRHLTNNNVWVFSHKIKELRCKLLLIVICKLCIFIMSSMLLVHMDVLRKPFRL